MSEAAPRVLSTSLATPMSPKCIHGRWFSKAVVLFQAAWDFCTSGTSDKGGDGDASWGRAVVATVLNVVGAMTRAAVDGVTWAGEPSLETKSFVDGVSSLHEEDEVAALGGRVGVGGVEAGPVNEDAGGSGVAVELAGALGGAESLVDTLSRGRDAVVGSGAGFVTVLGSAVLTMTWVTGLCVLTTVLTIVTGLELLWVS